MPHFRKLWTKITTSDEFQAMPDDTARLAWTLLPLALDREGRGIYNGAWLRSRLFPLREDVENARARSILDWWRDHAMIVVYAVDGHEYFYLPTWTTYQGHTDREAISEIPPPPHEEVKTYARPALDFILHKSGTSAAAEAEAYALAEAEESAEASGAATPDLPAAASDPADSAALLANAGVGEPERSRLACLSPPVVEWAISQVRNRGRVDNPAGLLVRILRDELGSDGDPPARASPELDRHRFIEGEYADYIEH